MTKATLYLIVGLLITFLGIYMESNLILFFGCFVQMVAALMRTAEGPGEVKNKIIDKLKK
jgi:hypothetical protein